jgi:hypothetical protein
MRAHRKHLFVANPQILQFRFNFPFPQRNGVQNKPFLYSMMVHLRRSIRGERQMDAWASGWFKGPNGQKCRVIFEQRGDNMLELLEYDDGERHRFEWVAETMIRGKGFSRLGLHVMEIPEPVVQEINRFVCSVPTKTKVTRNLP